MREKLNGLRVKMLSSPWVVMLLLLPFFKPDRFLHSGYAFTWEADLICTYWKFACILFAGIFFVAKPKVSIMTVCMFAYYILYLIADAVNGSDGDMFYWVRITMSIVALGLLIDNMVDTDPAALVKGLLWGLGILCIINLGTVIAFPGGMDYVPAGSYYFMDCDNGHSFFMIPLLVVAMLYTWSKRWPLYGQLLLLALFSSSIYITWAAGGMVAVSVFIVLFLVYRVKYSDKLFNICTMYAAIAVFFLLIVVLQATEWLSPLISGVLHKDITLSSRLPLWDRVMAFIRERPIFGYGWVSEHTMIEMFGLPSCHNVFLQSMFDMGIIGTALLLGMLGLLIRPLMRTKKSFGGYILAAGVFSSLIAQQFEGMAMVLMVYCLFLLAYHAEKITAALDPDGPADGIPESTPVS